MWAFIGNIDWVADKFITIKGAKAPIKKVERVGLLSSRGIKEV